MPTVALSTIFNRASHEYQEMPSNLASNEHSDLEELGYDASVVDQYQLPSEVCFY